MEHERRDPWSRVSSSEKEHLQALYDTRDNLMHSNNIIPRDSNESLTTSDWDDVTPPTIPAPQLHTLQHSCCQAIRQSCANKQKHDRATGTPDQRYGLYSMYISMLTLPTRLREMVGEGDVDRDKNVALVWYFNKDHEIRQLNNKIQAEEERLGVPSREVEEEREELMRWSQAVRIDSFGRLRN